ncbi:cytochrome b5 domain-containing protein [Clostridium beijerinckii]|uniref:cytochrome b5 domain-containing protein n=1 Tax=Clostridium beijerinckii TaxID=1520 RepID=UPI00156E6DD2|nr:cytochrome b5 domain-containing protein [Clostridium beijerinckii]NRT72256.1 putative heme/steroid binding protein [Clostridium beijerinckii]
MSIYFDLKTIWELIEELAQYDVSNGKTVYMAVDGIVYDLSNVESWAGGKHFGFIAGKDLTAEFNSHHGMKKVPNDKPKIGILKVSKDKNATSKSRVTLEDIYDFSSDDWIEYITH